MDASGTVLLLWLVAAPAAGFDLRWQAPPELCPSAELIDREVARLVGEGPSLSPLTFEVVVEPPTDRGRWKGTLSVKTPHGLEIRSLEGESCKSLAKATAVIAAMILAEPRDQTASAERASDPTLPATSPIEPKPAPPPMPAARGPAPKAQPDSPLRLGLRVDLLATAGALPHIGAGAGLGVVLQLFSPAHLRLELNASAWLPQRKVLRDTPLAGGDFRWFALEALTCLAPWPSDLPWLSLCAGAEVAFLKAEGFGVQQPESHRQLVPTGLVGARLSWPLSPSLQVVAQLEGGVPLVRPMFRLEPLGDVHRATPVTARGGLGVEFLAF